jgi:hypothetical protein
MKNKTAKQEKATSEKEMDMTVKTHLKQMLKGLGNKERIGS